ncbi:MAG TPA: lysylphosphatidylglycerol synthase transmembrane domain-containing protein [Thermoleophilaceae bacterium]|nr:lysylphosphatidylglycerol synthase transmembrane domain-containing protein [Thermoleophilaceae bacterium]
MATVALSAYALARIGVGEVADALASVEPLWALLAFVLMAASMVFRSEAWYAVLTPALPGRTVHRSDVTRATMIGVFMSAVLPGRVGEAGRAIVLSRRLGRVSRQLPVVIGTLFSQTLLNVLGLFAVAAIALAGSSVLEAHAGALTLVVIVPAVLLIVVILGPWAFGRASPRSPLLRKAADVLAVRLSELRRGLLVFRRVSATTHALSVQLAAWALQLLSVYVLLVAFGLEDQAGLAAAAAVLTAVNVAGIVPVTPSNVGIFQAACVLVLAAWGIGSDAALAYGILLQAIEVAVALALGLPALAGEHISFRHLRQTAEHLPETGTG